MVTPAGCCKLKAALRRLAVVVVEALDLWLLAWWPRPPRTIRLQCWNHRAGLSMLHAEAPPRARRHEGRRGREGGGGAVLSLEILTFLDKKETDLNPSVLKKQTNKKCLSPDFIWSDAVTLNFCCGISHIKYYAYIWCMQLHDFYSWIPPYNNHQLVGAADKQGSEFSFTDHPSPLRSGSGSTGSPFHLGTVICFRCRWADPGNAEEPSIDDSRAKTCWLLASWTVKMMNIYLLQEGFPCTCLKLLWNAQASLHGVLHCQKEVVLLPTWVHLGQPHSKSPRESKVH